MKQEQGDQSVVFGLNFNDRLSVEQSSHRDYGPTLDLTMRNHVGEVSFMQMDLQLAEQLYELVEDAVIKLRER